MTRYSLNEMLKLYKGIREHPTRYYIQSGGRHKRSSGYYDRHKNMWIKGTPEPYMRDRIEVDLKNKCVNYYVWGNLIARLWPEEDPLALYITSAGHSTRLTKNRLDGLINYFDRWMTAVDGVWFIHHRNTHEKVRFDGEYIFGTPPEGGLPEDELPSWYTDYTVNAMPDEEPRQPDLWNIVHKKSFFRRYTEAQGEWG